MIEADKDGVRDSRQPSPAELGEIDANAIPRHSEYVTAEPFGDDIIVFHLASKQYVLLHAFAAALWNAVDGTSPVSSIAARSGDADAARSTLAGLRELGLLELVT